MKIWLAIPTVVALFVLSVIASGYLHFSVVIPMVLATSLWAAIDSSRIGLARYKSGISYGPGVLFLACAMLWIIGFPWYLVMRDKITSGVAVLKEAPSSPTA